MKYSGSAKQIKLSRLLSEDIGLGQRHRIFVSQTNHPVNIKMDPERSTFGNTGDDLANVLSQCGHFRMAALL